MSYYMTPANSGLISTVSTGDGYTIYLKWNTAYPSVITNKIAYSYPLPIAPEQKL